MKQYRITLIFLLISFITVQCQNSSENTNMKALPAEVVETIEKRIEEGVTPSIAIAIIDSSSIQYFSFGRTAEDGKKVDENTIYEIGSISKVFTAIILAQQVQKSELKLEDEINSFLPNDIKVPVMGDMDITFGNLTDHTSGLPRMPDNFNPANPNNPFADYSVGQMYEFISNYQPVRTVGSEYEYSNIAQGLLGHLLALCNNSTYEELMIQSLANPLDMNDTRIKFTQRMKENLALGHSRGEVVENWDIPALPGAGAIRSSTSDMAKFISANLGYVNNSFMEAMKLTHKVRHDKAGDMSVAMAWHIKKGDNGDVIWHNGGTGGYSTFAGFVKETGKGVVLLTNSSTGSDDIGFYLLDPGSKLKALRFKSEAVDIAESTLEQYVGVYELQPEFKITVSKEGKQLFIQATGQERIEIYPENETVFYLTVVKAKITFKLKRGVVKSLTLLQGGRKTTGLKLED